MDKLKYYKSLTEVLDVPLPEETKSYKPVSHSSLVTLTKDCTNEAGFQLKKESYRASRNGNAVTAYYDFNYGGDPEMGLRIAWQNSYDKSVTLKFAIGGNVFVCSNGAFHGDMGAFKKKHTGDVQVFTPEKIFEYFKTADDTFQQLVSHKDQLKKVKIDKKLSARLIGDMYINEQIIKFTQVGIITGELENPSFEYQAENTAWELYNHVTHSLKEIPPTEYLDSHNAVHTFFLKEFGIKSKFDQLELPLTESVIVPKGEFITALETN